MDVGQLCEGRTDLCLNVFNLFIPISKVLSPGLFQCIPEMDQSLPSPSKLYQKPLIVTLFICAHSEAAKQCDKWALPCASACVVGVRLFMDIEGGGYMFPYLPLSNPVYTDKKKAVQQVPCRKITSCALGLQRANLLFWIGIGKRLPIYDNVSKISLAFKSNTDNYTYIFIQIS